MSDEVRAAVTGGRELWREADPGALAGSPVLLRYALSDEPLSVRLGAERLCRLQDVARSEGIDPSTLEELRPWVVGQVLDQAMRSGAGYDEQRGVDAVITGLAAAADVPVRYELGDAEATFAWFDELDRVIGVDYLMWTLDRVSAGHEPIDAHVEAWQRGDLSVAEREDRVMRRQYAALHERMLVDRNRAWVPRIEAMLGVPGSVFVLVGGAHLVGDTSIQAFLAAAGLHVVRLS